MERGLSKKHMLDRYWLQEKNVILFDAQMELPGKYIKKEQILEKVFPVLLLIKNF